MLLNLNLQKRKEFTSRGESVNDGLKYLLKVLSLFSPMEKKKTTCSSILSSKIIFQLNESFMVKLVNFITISYKLYICHRENRS